MNLKDIWRFLFNTGSRERHVLIFTEDGRCIEEDLTVLKGCAAYHDRMEAYVLDGDNLIKDKSSNKITQVIAERSSAPIPIRGFSNLKISEETIEAIGQETIAQTLVKIDRENAQNELLNKVLFLVAIPAVTVLIVVAVNVWQQRGG